jgi:hypothetical protein
MNVLTDNEIETETEVDTELEAQLAEVILVPLEGEIDQVSVGVSDTELTLLFPYHKGAIASVKAVEGSQYQPGDKAWSFTITARNVYALSDLVGSLRELFRREAGRAEAREDMRKEIADSVVESLREDFDHPRVSFEKQEGSVALTVPYDPKSIKLIKKIEGARWNSSDKVWLLPADAEKKIRSALNGIFKLLK